MNCQLGEWVPSTAVIPSRRSVPGAGIKSMIGSVMTAVSCIEPRFRVLFPIFGIFTSGRFHFLCFLEGQGGDLSQDMRRCRPSRAKDKEDLRSFLKRKRRTDGGKRPRAKVRRGRKGTRDRRMQHTVLWRWRTEGGWPADGKDGWVRVSLEVTLGTEQGKGR